MDVWFVKRAAPDARGWGGHPGRSRGRRVRLVRDAAPTDCRASLYAPAGSRALAAGCAATRHRVEQWRVARIAHSHAVGSPRGLDGVRSTIALVRQTFGSMLLVDFTEYGVELGYDAHPTEQDTIVGWQQAGALACELGLRELVAYQGQPDPGSPWNTSLLDPGLADTAGPARSRLPAASDDPDEVGVPRVASRQHPADAAERRVVPGPELVPDRKAVHAEDVLQAVHRQDVNVLPRVAAGELLALMQREAVADRAALADVRQRERHVSECGRGDVVPARQVLSADHRLPAGVEDAANPR